MSSRVYETVLNKNHYYYRTQKNAPLNHKHPVLTMYNSTKSILGRSCHIDPLYFFFA